MMSDAEYETMLENEVEELRAEVELKDRVIAGMDVEVNGAMHDLDVAKADISRLKALLRGENKVCPQCNGKGVLGSCLDMLGDTNPDECPTCEGNGLVSVITIAGCMEVPEVRALVVAATEYDTWPALDKALAPFLAAMGVKKQTK